MSFQDRPRTAHWKSVGLEAKMLILRYVLKRELALPRKKVDFELEKCANERGGRAAPCMGSVPVAEVIASEAPRKYRAKTAPKI